MPCRSFDPIPRLVALLVGVATAWPTIARTDYEQRLRYVGMACSKVQKDSFANPGNEIFINTVVMDLDTGEMRDLKHPVGARFYPDVKAGFVAREPVVTLWSGRSSHLKLLVAMWEHDGGGNTVDQFTYAFSTAAKVYMAAQSGGATAGARGVVKAAAIGSRMRPEDGGLGPDEFDRFLARNMRKVAGANHDLIGHSTVRISGGNWDQAPLRSYRGIRYHFRTQHRRGGAACYSFYRFERGRAYASAPDGAPAPAQGPRPDSAPRVDAPPAYDRGRERLQQPYRSAAPTRGELRARNRCDRPIFVAESYLHRDGRWRTAGWTRVAPGAVRSLEPGDDNRVVYLHATDGAVPSRHDGSRHIRYFEVVDRRFEYVEGASPSGPGVRGAVFHQVTMPSRHRDHTVDFECKAAAYRVIARNRCDRRIYIAMRYRTLDGRMITEGYSPFEPGEARDLNIDAKEPRVAFHASGARPTGWDGDLSYHEVISKGFRHYQGTRLDGPNRRQVGFAHVKLREDLPTSVVEFGCRN